MRFCRVELCRFHAGAQWLEAFEIIESSKPQSLGDPEASDTAPRFKPGQRAFVFADDLQRRAEWLDHLEAGVCVWRCCRWKFGLC